MALRLELPEAVCVIRDPQRPRYVHIAAANAILHASPDEVQIDDLLECVRRGHVAAEFGAFALNVRLGRRTPLEVKAEDIIVDVEFWVRYIAAMQGEQSGSGDEPA